MSERVYVAYDAHEDYYTIRETLYVGLSRDKAVQVALEWAKENAYYAAWSEVETWADGEMVESIEFKKRGGEIVEIVAYDSLKGGEMTNG